MLIQPHVIHAVTQLSELIAAEPRQPALRINPQEDAARMGSVEVAAPQSDPERAIEDMDPVIQHGPVDKKTQGIDGGGIEPGEVRRLVQLLLDDEICAAVFPQKSD